MQSPSTRLCSRAYSLGSAGCARLIANAMASDFHHEAKAATPANTRAARTPTRPYPMMKSNAMPTATTRRMNPAISSAERRLFCATWSYKGRSGYSKDTRTGPRDSSSASKYSRSVKRNMPARMFVGNVWILVLYL